MISQILRNVRALLRSFGHRPVGIVFAPSYDEFTSRTSNWADHWEIRNAIKFLGPNADSRRALIVARGLAASRQSRFIAFIGHGDSDALLTAPDIGKRGIRAGDPSHGCLIEIDDLPANTRNLFVFAWACRAGKSFGQRFKELEGCGFLGFNDHIGFIFNHVKSEKMWRDLTEDLIRAMLSRGKISASDKKWLRDGLLEMRDYVRTGEVDTGPYTRFNSMFLKRAAQVACAHVWSE